MIPGFSQKIDKLCHLWATAAILVSGMLAYANSFQAPFVLDDIYSIVLNTDIRSLDSLQFHTPRYLAYLSFAVNYHFGGTQVFGYHLVNLIIHLSSALMVYLLLRLTFRTPYFKALSAGRPDAGRDAGDSGAHRCAEKPGAHRCAPTVEWLIPLFVALVFAVHPIQTQAVTYIVQRMTSMAALFYLLSLVFYIMARMKMQTGTPESPAATATNRRLAWQPLILLTAATLAAVAAMKTKEIAFTLPLAIVLYEIFFFRGDWKKRFLSLLPLLATLPIVPLSVIGMQQMADSAATGAFSVEETAAFSAGDFDRTTYLLTQFRVIITYLRLLVLPVNQNLDYAYPVYDTFFVPQVFLSFLLLAGLFGLAVTLYIRSVVSADLLRTSQGIDRPDAGAHRYAPTAGLWRLVSFGVFWFFLTLAVESSLVPIQDVIVEHRLYLPGIGFFLAITAAVAVLVQRMPTLLPGRLVVAAALVLVMILGFATWQRNHIWSDDLRLWQDVIAKSPTKARPYNDLGVILIRHKRFEEAISYLSRSLELDPEYPYSYSNLGLALIHSGRSAEAVPLLKKAIGLHVYFTNAYINLAGAYNQLRMFDQTVRLLEANAGWLGERIDLHYHLGVAYYFTGNRAATLEQLKIIEQSGEQVMAQDLRRLLAGM